MQGGPPRYFYGPVVPDIIEAIKTGMPVGGFVGFLLGALVDAVRPAELPKFALYGSGLITTFLVSLVLASRVWS